jgi:hypothetical protein
MVNFKYQFAENRIRPSKPRTGEPSRIVHVEGFMHVPRYVQKLKRVNLAGVFVDVRIDQRLDQRIRFMTKFLPTTFSQFWLTVF